MKAPTFSNSHAIIVDPGHFTDVEKNALRSGMEDAHGRLKSAGGGQKGHPGGLS
ncbi:MAG: hypothetical protein OXP12_03860 [Thaumarchaeota archaeon]|nr:hypothetical protein [Nitrososphaerota archaeon]MDE0265943.1 hypothetical protein [Nitrososphaerota archaeon]MDE0525720.1 hypothetical protein [Nitrososphaerota archaeon]